jgi:PAS domain-containing protein
VAPSQKNLALIRARQFGANLSTAVFLTDAEGTLVFYNKSAEGLLGRTFEEAGEVRPEEWADVFRVERLDGSPMPLEEMPGGVALLERRPDHKTVCITPFDGTRRTISVTALPLIGREEEFYGMMAIFWPAE